MQNVEKNIAGKWAKRQWTEPLDSVRIERLTPPDGGFFLRMSLLRQKMRGEQLMINKT